MKKKFVKFFLIIGILNLILKQIVFYYFTSNAVTPSFLIQFYYSLDDLLILIPPIGLILGAILNMIFETLTCTGVACIWRGYSNFSFSFGVLINFILIGYLIDYIKFKRENQKKENHGGD